MSGPTNGLCCLKPRSTGTLCTNPAKWVIQSGEMRNPCNRSYELHLRCDSCYTNEEATLDRERYRLWEPECCMSNCTAKAFWRAALPSENATLNYCQRYAYHLRCDEHRHPEGYVPLYGGTLATVSENQVLLPLPPRVHRQGRRTRRHLAAPSNWDDMWDDEE